MTFFFEGLSYKNKSYIFADEQQYCLIWTTITRATI